MEINAGFCYRNCVNGKIIQKLINNRCNFKKKEHKERLEQIKSLTFKDNESEHTVYTKQEAVNLIDRYWEQEVRIIEIDKVKKIAKESESSLTVDEFILANGIDCEQEIKVIRKYFRKMSNYFPITLMNRISRKKSDLL